MTRKYLIYGILTITVMIGYNAFLIQRDAKLFDAYYQQSK
jgi:hypothetical protein